VDEYRCCPDCPIRQYSLPPLQTCWSSSASRENRESGCGQSINLMLKKSGDIVEGKMGEGRTYSGAWYYAVFSKSEFEVRVHL
jgi:hypothetical protein